jgi:hypothetical protein
MYIILEIIIFISTAVFLFYQFVNRGKYRIPFFVGIVATIAVESVNEFVFAGQGTFYPQSLIYFPFTRFTFGIVFLGALYSIFIHCITLKLFAFSGFRNVLFKYLIYLLVLIVSIPFELSGIYLGYWKLHKIIPAGHYLYYYLVSVYIFYFAFTIPVFMVSEKFFSRSKI